MVSEPILEQTFAELLEDLLRRKTSSQVRAPFGVEFLLTPSIQSLDVSLASGSACPSCIDVGAEWDGRLNVYLGSPTGGVLVNKDIDWSAVTSATVNVFTAPNLDGTRVLQARKARSTPVALDVEFGGLPEPYNTLATAWLENQLVEQTLNDALATPIELLALPDTGQMQVRDVRVRAYQGLAIELLFTSLGGGQAPVLASDDGWVAAIPAASLIGLARAATLRELPEDDYTVEPWSLELFAGDRFNLGVRVWKASRRATWRDYEVRGTVRLDEQGVVQFDADMAAETDKSGWAGRVAGPIVRHRVLKSLRAASTMSVPGHTEHPLGDTNLVVRTLSLEARDDLLVLRGDVEVPGRTPNE